jgi:hypothetical protein
MGECAASLDVAGTLGEKWLLVWEKNSVEDQKLQNIEAGVRGRGLAWLVRRAEGLHTALRLSR